MQRAGEAALLREPLDLARHAYAARLGCGCVAHVEVDMGLKPLPSFGEGSLDFGVQRGMVGRDGAQVVRSTDGGSCTRRRRFRSSRSAARSLKKNVGRPGHPERLQMTAAASLQNACRVSPVM